MTLLGWTALLYLCNLGLGVGLQLWLFHLRWPIVHHVLYGLIFALTLLSLLVLWRARAFQGCFARLWQHVQPHGTLCFKKLPRE